MELQDYMRVMRKRWRIIATTFVLALLGATAFNHFSPKSYQATTKLMVSTSSGGASAAELANGSAFAQKQMKTYADVMTSDIVLGPVSRQLHLDGTEGLKQSVSILVPADTVLLQVQTVNRDPALAARISNAVARQFAKTVPTLQSGSLIRASVVQGASLPSAPVSPRPVFNLLLAGLTGLLLGVVAGVGRERLDVSIRNTQDLHRVTDLPVIGRIHYDREAERHPLILHGDLQGRRAESYRTLRTNLRFVEGTTQPRSIMVTSSVADEGKTTNAVNLAVTLGLGGSSVCLVDADLRRPSMHTYMGIEGSVGVSSVLSGTASLENALQPYAERIAVLAAGVSPPNPSELLGSQAMSGLLAALTARFDYVIIDVPPLIPVTDAAVVAAQVDGTILVVGSGVATRQSVSQACESLHTIGARVLGVVLNRLPSRGPDANTYGATYPTLTGRTISPSIRIDVSDGARPNQHSDHAAGARGPASDSTFSTGGVHTPTTRR